jgi:hypothetical protein
VEAPSAGNYYSLHAVVPAVSVKLRGAGEVYRIIVRDGELDLDREVRITPNLMFPPDPQ